MKFKYLFPQRLRQIRHEKGLTQNYLSNKMKGHTKLISGYELGTHRVTLKKLIKLAEILDIDPCWLMGDVIKKGNNNPK